MGRYRLDRALVEDRAGVSYRATRVEDGMLVRARAIGDRTMGDLGSGLEPRDHPTLPRVLDHFLGPDGTPWLIFEHVGGTTLAELGALEPTHVRDPDWLAWLVHTSADALAYAHAQSPALVHGRLSPEVLALSKSPEGERLHLLDLDPAPAHRDPKLDIEALASLVIERLGADWRERVANPRLVAVLDGMHARASTSPPMTAAQVRDATAELVACDCVHGPSTESSRSPPTAAPRTSKPSPRFMMGEPPASSDLRPEPRPKPARKRKPPTTSPQSSSRSSRADIPVMRPEDLSRELSQAYRATAALEQRQRKQLVYARVMVVLLAATITALATYLLLQLRT